MPHSVYLKKKKPSEKMSKKYVPFLVTFKLLEIFKELDNDYDTQEIRKRKIRGPILPYSIINAALSFLPF
jgi:hypothetical protein